MDKLNLLETHPSYYAAADHPEFIEVEQARYISLPATGSFTESVFTERIAVLRQAAQLVADGLNAAGQAFEVSVLEGLYWHAAPYGEHSIAQVFTAGPLRELLYRLLIRVPDYVTAGHIAAARAALVPSFGALAEGLELFEYQEGRCVQMLHHGPFAEEHTTLRQLEAFATAHNLSKGGMHHEIYLVDFTVGGSQEHLRTILREPVK